MEVPFLFDAQQTNVYHYTISAHAGARRTRIRHRPRACPPSRPASTPTNRANRRWTARRRTTRMVPIIEKNSKHLILKDILRYAQKLWITLWISTPSAPGSPGFMRVSTKCTF
jgi:hypothetical protein